MKNNLNKKGFVLSLDSLIAITLLSFFAVISIFYISQVTQSSWQRVDLVNASREELTFLEKNLVLEEALSVSSSEGISSSINLSPERYCFELSVFPKATQNVPVLHALKSGCSLAKDDVVSVERTVIKNDYNEVSFFVAQLKAWYK